VTKGLSRCIKCGGNCQLWISSACKNWALNVDRIAHWLSWEKAQSLYTEDMAHFLSQKMRIKKLSWDTLTFLSNAYVCNFLSNHSTLKYEMGTISAFFQLFQGLRTIWVQLRLRKLLALNFLSKLHIVLAKINHKARVIQATCLAFSSG
jgi:hypothetical protein